MISFSRAQIIRITITLILFSCMIFANFYAVRKIQQYAVDVYFYDKMLVAMDIAGPGGLKKELTRIAAQEKFRREEVLLKDFERILPGLKDPKEYLENIVAEKKDAALRVREFRLIAIYIILAILLMRALIFLAGKKIKKGA